MRRIISRIHGQARGVERHVFPSGHSPIPSTPKRCAMGGISAVSALRDADVAGGIGLSPISVAKGAPSAGSTMAERATRPPKKRGGFPGPVEPSTVIDVALVKIFAPRHGQHLLAPCSWRRVRRRHAGQARPRAISRGMAWFMPPRSVRIGLRGMHCADILGAGFPAHEDAGLALRSHGLRGAGWKRRSCRWRRLGAAAMPRVSTSRAAVGLTWRAVQKLVQRGRRVCASAPRRGGG